jgi:probable F420-dependent oxidoreductase
MRIGVTVFLTDQTMGPAELGRALEERGYQSYYAPEHTHIPVSRATPAPMGEPLPGYYSRTLDPFVALSTLAAVAPSVRVGTGICLVAQHDPLVLAKAAATLDLVTGGNFDLGVGFGWNREEMADHGVDFGTRRGRVREAVHALRELWAHDVAVYDGEFVKFQESWSWPKPAAGSIPILIGGAAGPKLFRAVLDYADGWMPIGGRGLTQNLPLLRAAAEEVGRDPATLRVVPFGTEPTDGKMEHYREMGVDEVVFNIPSGTREEILPVLDAYARYLNGA